MNNQKIEKLKEKPFLFFMDFFNNSIDKFRTIIPFLKKKEIPSIQYHNVNIDSKCKIALFSGENEIGISHIDLWEPTFLKSNVEYIVIVSNLKLFNKIVEKYINIKAIYIQNQSAIKKVFSKLTKLQTIFYPSNTGSNMNLIKYNHIKHIFIGHGDSDKTASAHKIFRMYEENWVAGEAHIDRFKNSKFDSTGLKHVKVGRPNLLDILKNSTQEWQKRFENKINILYLPTWEGAYKEQDYSSLKIIKEIVNITNLKSSNSDLSINIKLHPFTGKRDNTLNKLEKKLNNIKNCNIVSKENTVFDSILKSNIFICDISAVITECLASNCPIFVYIPKDKEVKISSSKMPYQYYCYTFSTIEELGELLNKVIINRNDILSKNRTEALEYILNKTDTLNNIFEKKLKEENNEK